jgi:hypothetical protein
VKVTYFDVCQIAYADCAGAMLDEMVRPGSRDNSSHEPDPDQTMARRRPVAPRHQANLGLAGQRSMIWKTSTSSPGT